MIRFTIKELETLSGIKAHTIRRWEKRHSVINPQRSLGNSRFYSLDELVRILNFSLLNKNGYKVSHLSALSNDELEQKIIGLTEAANQPGVIWWKKKKFEKELKEAKEEKKCFNKVIETMKRNDEYMRLKDYVRQNFGEEVLDRFFQISSNKV